MNTKRKKTYVISNLELMKEWDTERNNILGFSPEKTTIGSAKKVWWKCEMGHSWQSTVNDRSSGSNCPNCAQIQRTATRLQRFLDDNKSLATANPSLAQQWHPTENGGLKPQDVTVNSGKKVWWLCDKGHKWDAVVKSRNYGSNCPICSGHKVLVGYNDLATVNPKLAQQWHPTKNGELKPTDVTISNGRKFWWLCDLNHSWASTVANRNSGTGCPYCSNKKVLVGFNDLATTHPELAAQWHPTNNKSLTPQQFTAGANIKVWWKCEMGHSWQSTISHRKQGKGCPKCADEYKTSFPEQSIFFYLKQVAFAKNRHILDNRTEVDIFLPDYNIGIEYDGEFYHSGEKSQQREKRKEDKLKNLGITLVRVKETRTPSTIQSQNIIFSPSHPTEKQLNETINKLITHINNLINSNFSIDIDVSRDRNKIHEQYILNEKENSLLNTHPLLAEEWHPTKNGVLLPEHVRAGSNKKAWWLCKKGHEWDAVINSRRKGIGCPICSGRKVLPGYNDLATLLPDIAKEWHPTKNGDLKPSAVTKNSNKKVWWKCNVGHDWLISVYDRTRNKCNCPICSGKKVLPGFNDLQTKNPNLALEWNFELNSPLSPENFTCGSDKKVWWKCKNNHVWQATISSRTSGTGCPYCSGNMVLSGINDLATVNPLLAKEWNYTKNSPLQPTEILPCSNKKVWWKCKSNHEWEASINSRNSGRNCPYCSNQKVLSGFNDLQKTNPSLALEWHPIKNGNLKPTAVIGGSNKKVWWKCKNNHVWQATISSRNTGCGCPYCYNEKRKKK